MKKAISIVLTICLALSLSPAATLAENQSTYAFTPADYVTLGELSAQALCGWHETYAAYGREVVANVDIRWMPDVDACPIVQIQPLEINVSESVLDQYRGKGNLVEVSTKQNPYVFIQVDQDLKNHFLKGYARDTRGIWEETEVSFRHGDIPTIKPEGLDCTYQEFYDFMNSRLLELTGVGLEQYWTMKLDAGNVIWLAKERDGRRVRVAPMTRWGSWTWCGYQMFHGVPMRHCGATGPSGYLICNYYGNDAYVISQHPVTETAVLMQDAPLLSFDAMKRVWEAQIAAGKLRGVDELEFGYVSFQSKGKDDVQWVLQPVWILTGGYTEDIRKEQVMPYHDPRDKDGSLTCPAEYGRHYYNAQTGELLQMPEYNQPMRAYETLTWEAVGGK